METAIRKSPVLQIVGFTLAALGICLTSLYSYLLFHTTIELLTIVVVISLFVLSWNTRHYHQNGYLTFVAICYACIAAIDLVHTMAYKGMNILPNSGGNLSAQLWIGARYLQAIVLCLAPIFARRKFSAPVVVCLAATAAATVVTLVLGGNFPLCHIEGQGLTPFKIVSEYIIISLLALAFFLFFGLRGHFAAKIWRLMLAAIAMTAASEFCFTLFVGVYDFANMLGHVFKLAAFFMIYRAILVSGIVEPFSLIFKDLQTSQNQLLDAQAGLEQKVHERTADLEAAQDSLKTSLAEKETLLRELYHRTKNNMGLIISLLYLQAEQDTSPELRRALRDAQNRILAMALVHEKLYETQDLSRISLKDYTENLVKRLAANTRDGSQKFQFILEVQDIPVVLDLAIPLGLILNELVVNVLKHAFPGDRTGTARISIQRNDGHISLEVSDNGVGVPPGTDPRSQANMGLQTLLTLAQDQLKAHVEFQGSPGFTCRISFDASHYSTRP